MPIPASRPRPVEAPVQNVPIARPLLPDARDLTPYLERIDEARWYSNFGPLLIELEARLTARFERPTALATVSNGTAALTLGLQALGCEPGGLVAVPAFTFVATAHAVRQAGLEPWLLDVDPDTWMLDPASVADALDTAPGPVEAVIPVAAFGRLPDLKAWARFRRATGVPVLVDGAAAFDAVTAAPVPITVSLHATKSVSTGEGGFVASEDANLVARVRQLTAFGFAGARASQIVAHNAKLSEFAAAVGLASLDGWPAARLRWARAAQSLRMSLALTPQIVFQPGWGAEWVSSVCVVGVPDGRAPEMAAALAAQGVETRAWWGEGLHRQPAFEHCLRGQLSATDQLAASTLGLPFFIDMTDADTNRVAAALSSALEGA